MNVSERIVRIVSFVFPIYELSRGLCLIHLLGKDKGLVP